jgi:hypothetical protein
VTSGDVIGTGDAFNLFPCYLFGAGLIVFAAIVEVVFGAKAEGQSLESVAKPLPAIEEATGASAATRACSVRAVAALSGGTRKPSWRDLEVVPQATVAAL